MGEQKMDKRVYVLECYVALPILIINYYYKAINTCKNVLERNKVNKIKLNICF